MKYSFSVQEPYKSFLLNWQKTIEWRLNKWKYAGIQEWDILQFDTWESFIVENVTKHNSFIDMIKEFGRLFQIRKLMKRLMMYIIQFIHRKMKKNIEYVQFIWKDFVLLHWKEVVKGRRIFSVCWVKNPHPDFIGEPLSVKGHNNFNY